MTKYTKYKWRLYADNNIEAEIVEFLRTSGIDVVWVTEDAELRKQQDDDFHYARARQMQRYLLSHDMDFWDDRRFPLIQSPGVVILDSTDTGLSKHLPLLLRKLMQDYNPLDEPLYLDGMKFKLDAEGVTVRTVDRDTQKVTTDKWNWTELF